MVKDNRNLLKTMYDIGWPILQISTPALVYEYNFKFLSVPTGRSHCRSCPEALTGVRGSIHRSPACQKKMFFLITPHPLASVYGFFTLQP